LQERFASWHDAGGLSRERIASNTGIFREDMAKEYPWYRVEKKHSNNQYLKNYLKGRIQNIWDALHIDIRPTPRGLFVVRLSRRYSNKTLLTDMAQDVQAIQGQGQLAEEVCRHFVRSHNDLDVKGFKLVCPDSHKHSSQDNDDLYNFYVVYHLQDLFDERGAPIRERAIRDSRPLQDYLVLLSEGVLLEQGGQGKVPNHRQTYLDAVLAQDKASWEDERFLLNRHTAILIPSQNARGSKLLYARESKAEEPIMYDGYCRALERMLEFIVEVRFLAQVVERESWKACQEAVDWMRKVRGGLGQRRGNVVDQRKLMESAQWVASLSLLLSDCQEWSTPRTWSRADHAAKKAEYLFEQMGVSLFLENAERNVNNKNALIDHIDDVRLTELSEYGTHQASVISTTLAAISLALVLYSLPQFWWYMNEKLFGHEEGLVKNFASYLANWHLYEMIIHIGNVFALLFLVFSFLAIMYGMYQLYRLHSFYRRNK
jgi:hypothetical protein